MVDTELGTKFNSEPRAYGGVVLSDNENAFLKLSPKFSIFQPVKETAVMSELDKALTKLRWKRTIEEQRPQSESVDDGVGIANDITENLSQNERAVSESFENEMYDPESRTFSLARVPATNVPFNKRVKMPTYCDEETESKISYAREKIRKVIKDACTKSKGCENLDMPEKQGCDSLKERLKSSEIIVYPTDKSGRLSVDSPDNYITSMQKHIRGMEEVTQATYTKV